MGVGKALRLGCLAALTACLLVGCMGGDKESAETPELTLRVMTFNLFYGGDEMKLPSRDWCTDPAGCQDTFAAVVDAIRRSRADVVGLQEATGNTRKVAQRLGWNFNERTAIISRFPIIDPPDGNGLYVYVEPAPGRIVAVSNAHLPASPYGPYRAQAGWSKDRVVALEERLRLPVVAEQVDELPDLAMQKIPVFMTGDFNSPSHLDWTPAADSAREDVPYPVEWPVSKALADAGFRDSFRAVNPDPTKRPGFTWTPGGPESAEHEVFDRIDWVLSAGPARAIDSSVVGEEGNENVDIALPRWPSDHRGVVSTFRVAAAPTPELVAVSSRSLEQGQSQHVLSHAEHEGAKVVVQPAGEVSGQEGRSSIATKSLAPGRYEVVLEDAGSNPLATTEFFLYARGADTTVSPSKPAYGAGEPIDVSWTNAPGMKWDWVAIFKARDGSKNTATDCPIGYCGNGNYLLYKYTHASIEGATTFGEEGDAGSGTWPLPPGTYDVRLLVDDGYTRAAISKPFEIVEP